MCRLEGLREGQRIHPRHLLARDFEQKGRRRNIFHLYNAQNRHFEAQNHRAAFQKRYKQTLVFYMAGLKAETPIFK